MKRARPAGIRIPDTGKSPALAAAEAYENFLVPALNTRPAAEIIKTGALQPGERILDVACGTGIVARLAVPCVAPGGCVTGVDIDPAMLAVAKSVVREQDGVTTSWHCASAHDMPFESGAFDAALCLQGLQYFPDCLAGLTEIRRALKSSGRFIGAVWSSIDDCKGQNALARALERRNIDTTTIHKAYSFGGSERLQELAVKAGFREAKVRSASLTSYFASAADFVEAFASGSLSSRVAISKVPADERREFLEEVQRELHQFEDGRGIALPLGYRVLIARP